MSVIRIMITEDHAMIREGLKQLLELEADLKVVALAVNGREAVEQYRAMKPDVVLMDVNMPQMNGLEALAAIRELDPEAHVIMLTIHSDREYLFKALDSGALGYVLKDAESRVLVEAIRTVSGGQTFIQPSMARELVTEFRRIKSGGADDNPNQLTERELDVLRLLAGGMLNRDIATTLYISEKTVKNHISSIFRKLEVQDRTQAAILAIRNKLV